MMSTVKVWDALFMTCGGLSPPHGLNPEVDDPEIDDPDGCRSPITSGMMTGY